MSVNDNRLTKEELQYLIEELGAADDEPVDTPLESSAVPGIPQLDLKERLQRSVEEMRARNEEVPAHLLDLLERL
jgi:hypothetical protein